MTEEEWLTGTSHPQWMLMTLEEPGKLQRTKAGKRKQRLFACACCRVTWELLDGAVLRPALEAAEKFAEGRIGKEELKRWHECARPLTHGSFDEGAPGVKERTSAAMVAYACHVRAQEAAFSPTAYPVPLAGASAVGLAGDALLCHLLRDVFGNPFRPVPLERAWRTPEVVGMARAAYEERELPSGLLDRTRVGVLADALEDAGCGEQALLDHLRGPGPCVRGCHVVDLLAFGPGAGVPAR